MDNVVDIADYRARKNEGVNPEFADFYGTWQEYQIFAGILPSPELTIMIGENEISEREITTEELKDKMQKLVDLLNTITTPRRTFWTRLKCSITAFIDEWRC